MNVYDWLAQGVGKVPGLSLLGFDPAGMAAQAQDPFPAFAAPIPIAPNTRVLRNGLYSRLDEAAQQMLPAQGVNAQSLLNLLKKAPGGVSETELAVRGVPEWVASQGTAKVTPQMLAAHLQAHPAPFPQVKTLGGSEAWSEGLERAWNNREFGALGSRPSTPEQWTEASGRLERVAQAWQRNGDPAKANRYFALAEEATARAEAADLGRGEYATTKFARYQTPGGEAYRETLQTLPVKMRTVERTQGWDNVRQDPQGQWFRTRGSWPEWDTQPFATAAEARAALPAPTLAQEPVPGANYYSAHYQDPNLVVHTRANDRTVPGRGRGRFLEEVQSDWNQAGKKVGYTGDKPPVTEADIDLRYRPNSPHSPGHWESYNRRDGSFIYGHGADLSEQAARQQAVQFSKGWSVKAGVPDNPFRETWPDLGLKQQLYETAQDPQANWLGFTSGDTQAARYDLSKQVKTIQYETLPDGRIGIRAYGHENDEALSRTVAPTELPSVVGKEAADKILTSGTPTGELTGVDLKVGGEGMRAFYDQLLPKRLQKVLQAFGGKVESVAMTPNRMTKSGTGPMVDESTPAWLATLTPEMKARILKEGFPLLSLAGLAAAGTLRPRPSHGDSPHP